MNYTENIKKRIILLVIAITAYILVPIPIGLSMFSFFNPISFPLVGFITHVIQVFVLVILLYGALDWIKPSLVPKSISKKVVGGIIFGIVFLSILPTGILSLEPTGSCTIINNSQEGKSLSNDGRSTEQECIDSCLREGDKTTLFNQVRCEFQGLEKSWSKTPEEFQGYKPKI